jgi:hypothetical protein
VADGVVWRELNKKNSEEMREAPNLPQQPKKQRQAVVATGT